MNTPTRNTRSDAAILREAMLLFMLEQRKLLSELETPHGRLLIILLRRGDITQAELGRNLGLEKSWVSRSVDKLVALDWVARSAHPDDRRNVLLQLTAAGKQIARGVDARMNANASRVLDRLPATSRPRVVAALEELCAALQSPGDAL